LINPPLLECRNIAFERDDVPLFSGVNFQLHTSQAMQVKGANGIGKTTLLRILATSLTPTEGEVLWQNRKLEKQHVQFRRDMLYLGHSSGVKLSLTPRENLHWFFRIFPKSREDINAALHHVKLQGYENVPCHTLSAGQLRRVALARLYLSTASLWIMDEPFTAIDIDGVALLETLMASHLRSGGAIVVTSHQQLALENIFLLELESFTVAT